MVFSFNAFQLRASVRSEFPAHLLTWEGMTGHYAHTTGFSEKLVCLHAHDKQRTTQVN